MSVGSFVGPKSKVEIPATALAKPPLMSWADWLTKLCQAQERLRLHHNIMKGNVTKEGRDHRAVDIDVQSGILTPAILVARPEVTKESGWKPTPGDTHSMDSAIIKAKDDGRAEPLTPIEMTTLLEFDIDSLQGDTLEPDDPLEDFRTYTEVDPGDASIDVAENVITFVGTTDLSAYVYKDKGEGHFGETFEHLHTLEALGSDRWAELIMWAVSNIIGDATAMEESSDESLWVILFDVHLENTYIRLYERHGENTTFDFLAYIEDDTPYYLTTGKTDDTTGRSLIYDDAERTNLLETLVVVHGAAITYQYVYPIASFSFGSSFAISATSSDLDFQEGAEPEAYNIEVDVGTFTLTGIATELIADRTLPISVGAFTLTGIAVGLNYGYTLGMGVGSFVLTGQAVAFPITYRLGVGVGSFTLTGIAADLLVGHAIDVGTGAFTLAGKPADLLVARTLSMGAGSFVLTGQDVQLIYVELGNRRRRLLICGAA